MIPPGGNTVNSVSGAHILQYSYHPTIGQQIQKLQEKIQELLLLQFSKESNTFRPMQTLDINLLRKFVTTLSPDSTPQEINDITFHCQSVRTFVTEIIRILSQDSLGVNQVGLQIVSEIQKSIEAIQLSLGNEKKVYDQFMKASEVQEKVEILLLAREQAFSSSALKRIFQNILSCTQSIDDIGQLFGVFFENLSVQTLLSNSKEVAYLIESIKGRQGIDKHWKKRVQEVFIQDPIIGRTVLGSKDLEINEMLKKTLHPEIAGTLIPLKIAAE